MGDDDHRHSRLGEIAQDDEHLSDELRVEGRRDLVEEDDARLHHQRAGDRDALLLTPRELVWVLLGLLLEADSRQELERAGIGLAAGHVADAARGERHVVDRLQVGKEIELLEDDPDPLPDLGDLDSLGGDLLALEPDAPAVDRLEQVDAAQERALPAPARADHDERLARGHG